MVQQNVNFKYGETINYNGKSARIVSQNLTGSYLRIEVDGKIITVDKNDLFGMNKSAISGLDRQIEVYDEQIKENKNLIKYYNEIWYTAKSGIKEARNKMASLLDSIGVTNAFQITNAEHKKEYAALRKERCDARMTQISASANILSTANDTVSLALHKGDLQSRQLLFGLA